MLLFRCFLFIVIAIFYFTINNQTVNACVGTFACGDNVAQCKEPDGVTDCFTCGQPLSNCSNVWVCQNPGGGGSLDRACGAAGVVCAYGCGSSGCVLADNCSEDAAPTSPPGGGSNPCAPQPLGAVCGAGNCCGSDVCDASMCCPASAPNCNSAAPTPTPALGCTVGAWCGSACVSACVTSDLAYDASCGCTVTTGTFTGDWCGCPPSGGAGGGVVPTSPPSTDCVPCGSGVCCGGQSCDPGPPASCVGGPPPPPWEPPPDPSTYVISGNVFYDTNGNNVKDAGESGAGGTMMMVSNNPFEYHFPVTDGSGNYAQLTNASTTYGIQVISFPMFGSSYIVTPATRVSNSPSSGNDFALWQGNTINGAVFNDTDGDGVLDAGESRIANVAVRTSTGNCADGIDNVSGQEGGGGNGSIDAADRYCHTDLNAGNAASYEPTYKEGSGAPTSQGNATSYSSSGSNYGISGLANGTYQTLITVPAGYSATTANPVAGRVLNGSGATINFGIRRPVPVCNPALLTANPSAVNPGGMSTLFVTNCTDNENPPDAAAPPPFDWDPPQDDNPTNSGDPQCSDSADNDGAQGADTLDPDCHTDGNNSNPGTYNPVDDSESSGSSSCSDAGTGTPTNTATSSTVNWTSPTCPSSNLICTPSVIVNGPGGSTTYSTNITVPATYTVTGNVRQVADVSSCTPASGSPYTGANINILGGSVNQNQTTGASGQVSFACLPQNTYNVTLQIPAGFDVVGRSGGTNVGTNGIRFTNLSSNQTATFCIAIIDPWYQTTTGDVRLNSVVNLVPTGKYASTDVDYPGIYYSSDSSANFGTGGNTSVSTKGWLVNNEYSYNANTENRNGTVAYSFYKSRARQEGVTIRPLTVGTLDQNEITESGIYEANGNLVINTYNHIPGRRVVLLVNGDVTINTPISVDVSQGLLIVAAKGDITISKNVGTTTLTSTTSNLDGFYSAENNIIIDGDGCPAGVPDRRLNVGGALIANALKPFSTTGTGTVQLNRSICSAAIDNPALYVATRADFLTILTDFYKTSYTKWREVRP